MSNQPSDLNLRLWSENDLPLLMRLMGDPAMTEYLWLETMEQIEKRHQRYCQMVTSDQGHMYAIVLGDQQIPVGSVGYWETELEGQLIWEVGWSVLREYQGQGHATRATLLVAEQVRAQAKHRFMHAYPLVDNAASNAVCRKAGFTFQGEIEFESRGDPSKLLRYNNWRLDLYSNKPSQ